jgi:hypothetical protein
MTKVRILAAAVCALPLLGGFVTAHGARAADQPHATTDSAGGSLVRCDEANGEWWASILDGVTLQSNQPGNLANVSLSFAQGADAGVSVVKARGSDWASDSYDLTPQTPVAAAHDGNGPTISWNLGWGGGKVTVNQMLCDATTKKVQSAHVTASAPLAFVFEGSVTADLVPCSMDNIKLALQDVWLRGSQPLGNATFTASFFTDAAGRLRLGTAQGTDNAGTYNLGSNGEASIDTDHHTVHWRGPQGAGVTMGNLKCDSISGKVKSAQVYASSSSYMFANEAQG